MPSIDPKNLLLVEDDERLAALVAEYLGTHGFRVGIEADGARAVDRIVAEQPDLVILDLMLPGEDGLSICRRIRPRYDGPVLMLTARGDEVDQVVGLEVGADDYGAKPASPRLLLARVSALLRRGRTPASSREVSRLEQEELVIDRASRVATLAGVELDLSTAEFDLLWVLVEGAGTVLSRDTLLEALRGIDYDGLDRSIDLRVSKLRQKLGDDPRQPARIKTVRGVGYLYVKGGP